MPLAGRVLLPPSAARGRFVHPFEVGDQVRALLPVRDPGVTHGRARNSIQRILKKSVERLRAPHDPRYSHCLRVGETLHAPGAAAKQSAVSWTGAVVGKRVAADAAEIDLLARLRVPARRGFVRLRRCRARCESERDTGKRACQRCHAHELPRKERRAAPASESLARIKQNTVIPLPAESANNQASRACKSLSRASTAACSGCSGVASFMFMRFCPCPRSRIASAASATHTESTITRR